MKLGNKGFGMRDFLIYLCILILILLFVAYSINNFYKVVESEDNKQTQKVVVPEDKPVTHGEKPKTVDYSYYHDLERKFKIATEQYLKDYPTQLDEGMIFKINYDDLVVLGYLDQFRNKNTGESCVGYSNIFRTANETKNTVETYINCGEYMTEGYR